MNFSSRNFKERLGAGVLSLLILILMVLNSSSPFYRPFLTLLLTAVISTAVWEYYRLTEAKGATPMKWLGITGSVIYIFSVYLTTQDATFAYLPYWVLWFLFVLSFLSHFLSRNTPLITLSVTFFAWIYLTIPLSYLLSVNFFHLDNGFHEGRFWLLYLIGVAKATDIGAYFTGKQYGRRKLAPTISPEKTWEGAFGGFFCGIAISLFFCFSYWFWNPAPLNLTPFEALGLGLVISFLAQIGDLAESILKRDAGVKDSNHLPGLGGMLDVVDSLVFVAPMMYFYLMMTRS